MTIRRRQLLSASILLPLQAVPLVKAEPPPWAESWPPTARTGKLVKCDKAPGFYTIDGIAALFVIAPNACYHAGGAVGFGDREFDPAPGTHVIEINPDSRDEHLDRRYAVVR